VLEVLLGAGVFTLIVMCLVLVILVARSKLIPVGTVEVVLDAQRRLEAPLGAKLLEVLFDNGIAWPAGCGGKGTCGLCRVELRSGGGSALPIEVDRLSGAELARGVRLACQVTLREDVELRVPEELLDVEHYRCRVRSNRNVASFIKELVLELPAGKRLEFRAGAYVLLECPPYRTSFADFDVDGRFRSAWDELDLWRFNASATQSTRRAYSLANPPGDDRILMLDVRIATPPPNAPPGIPPGVVSSYIFQLKPGDEVVISGPFGHFFAEDSQREMVFVGGGAGMAPLRSHIFDQLERLRSERTISFWYGARSLRELFYTEDFERLQQAYENFRWVPALSEPRPDDDWKGAVGFIHQVLFDAYLKQHPAPESCEYYLCGPPLLVHAVCAMLDELGVEPANIRFDDFGG